MHVSQPPLYETDKENREQVLYRAALLSVRAHTQSRGRFLAVLPPNVRPLPLRNAVEMIQSLTRPTLKLRATRAAAGMLADAAYNQSAGRESETFSKPLRVLLGDPAVDKLEGAIKDKLPSTVVNRGILIERLTYGLEVVKRVSNPKGIVVGGGQVQVSDGNPSSSTLNLETLVTTVTVSSLSTLSFEKLASFVDPQNWHLNSSCWAQSYKVRENSSGRPLLEKDPSPTSPNGWQGYLYEHVVCDWNTYTFSEFENYLRINFTVDRDSTSPKILLKFSLYSCLGSRFGGLVMQSGVDVDYGSIEVKPWKPKPKAANEATAQTTFQIVATKNIRFSDLLNRRIPGQGDLGAGLILAHMSPASVGLWMSELINVSLYSGEARTTGLDPRLLADEAHPEEMREGGSDASNWH